ncbi:MAG: hypothetical protein KAS53_06710 [Candidatus Cloacimonetes bacterium]|nr:hypothetical protein [Candidatus Cloacimonadota bacterium]
MKKSILVLIVIVVAAGLFAQNSGLGAGIIVGEPTGISLKYWTGNLTAFDGAIAWSFGKEDALHLHADMLMHNPDLIAVTQGSLPVYYGLGVRIKLEDKSKLGVRIPVGMAYQFVEAPFDIFLEIVPLLDLVPATDFGLNAAIGVRYFF